MVNGPLNVQRSQCGQTWQLPALALQRAHRKWPLCHASVHHTAPPPHSYCTQTCEERGEEKSCNNHIKHQRGAPKMHPKITRGVVAFSPTRCSGPALLGGWSQSHHAAQRVYRGAPLHKHIHHMLTVRHNLHNTFSFHVLITCVIMTSKEKTQQYAIKLTKTGSQRGLGWSWNRQKRRELILWVTGSHFCMCTYKPLR